MKSRDLIKLLKEVDPEGECHIRTSGGAVLDVEKKAGYWDGMYKYIDDDGNFVFSTKGDKIDVDSIDLEGWIWNGKGNENKVKFELTYLDDGKHEKEIKEKIIKYVNDRDRLNTQLMKSSVYDIMVKIKDGWKITVKGDKWTGTNFIKGLKKERLTIGEIKTLEDSKLFELVKNQWKLIKM